MNFLEKIPEKGRSKLTAILGIDPASSCTGWSLVIVDENNQAHLIDCGVIKPSDKLESHEQLAYMHDQFVHFMTELLPVLEQERISFLGYGVEIPAVLLGGKKRASRDITQIQAIGAVRAAMGYYKKLREHIVRPISVHAAAGANSTKYFTKLKVDLREKFIKEGVKKKSIPDKVQAEVKKIKKRMVKDWVEKNFTLHCSIKKFDESDSAVIAVLAWRNLK